MIEDGRLKRISGAKPVLKVFPPAIKMYILIHQYTTYIVATKIYYDSRVYIGKIQDRPPYKYYTTRHRYELEKHTF